MTRRVIKDGSEYFGPYTSVRTVKVLLDLIKELYQLRTSQVCLIPFSLINSLILFIGTKVTIRLNIYQNMRYFESHRHYTLKDYTNI